MRPAPSALLVFPDVETENFGANFRLAQLVTWNGTLTGELVPSALEIVPVISVGLQLVGLNVTLNG